MPVACLIFVIPAKRSASRDRGAGNEGSRWFSFENLSGSPVPDLRFAASGMTTSRID
jgi:hypothetical protein